MTLFLKLTFSNLMALWLLLSLTSALPHLAMKMQQDAVLVMGTCSSQSCASTSAASPYCCQAKAVYRGGACLSSPKDKQTPQLAPACSMPGPEPLIVTQLPPATLTVFLTAETALHTTSCERSNFQVSVLDGLAQPPEKIPIA